MFLGRNGGGHSCVGCPQRSRFGVFQVRRHRDGIIAPGQYRARHRKPTRKAGTHVGDLLVEVARHITQACGIGVVGGGIAQLGAGHEIQIRPERAIRIERHFIITKAQCRRRVLDLRAIDRVVQLLARRKRPYIHAIQLLEHTLQIGQLVGLCLRTDIGQAAVACGGVGIAILITTRGLLRAPCPFGLVDRLEGVVCGGGLHSGRGSLGSGKRRQQTEGKQQSFHGCNPVRRGQQCRMDCAQRYPTCPAQCPARSRFQPRWRISRYRL